MDYLRQLVSRSKAGQPIPLPYDAITLAFSEDDGVLAVGMANRTVKLFDVATHTEISSLGTPDLARVWSSAPVAFSPTTDLFAYAIGRTVNLRAGGYSERRLEPHDGDVYDIEFSWNGRLLASQGRQQTVCICDVNTGQCLKRIEDVGATIGMLAFSPNDDTLAFGTSNGTITLWNAIAGEEIRTWQGHADKHFVDALAFSLDGQFLASGAEMESVIKVWNLKGQNTLELPGHSDTLMSLSFATNGRDVVLASASRDNTVRIWEIPSGKLIEEIKGHSGAAYAEFSHDGKILASTGSDRSLVFWDMNRSPSRCTLPHDDWIGDVAFCSDSRRFVSLAGVTKSLRDLPAATQMPGPWARCGMRRHETESRISI